MTGRSAPRSPVRGAIALLLVFSSSALAHDLWVVPGKYRLGVDEVTRVFVNNGDVFPESLTLFGQHRLSGVRSVSSTEELPVSEFRVDGKSLTFDFRSAGPGSHLIVLATRARMVRMKAEDFEDYLADEGLTAPAELRKERGETSAPAVERYFKWAKAIVDVGDEPGSQPFWSEPAGERFEIVPIDHPNRIAPGGTLRLRVLFEGQPLPAVNVTGARASGRAREISARTDERGEVSVAVTAPGRWYVKAIHMVHLEGDPEVAWESYWATLSFEVQSTSGNAR